MGAANRSGVSVSPSGSRQERARDTGNLTPDHPKGRLARCEQAIAEMREQLHVPVLVQVLQLQRGDVLVLSTPGSVSQQAAAAIKEIAERQLQETGVTVWVLGDGLHAQAVLRGQEVSGESHSAGRL
jgi:hypothetical protein